MVHWNKTKNPIKFTFPKDQMRAQFLEPFGIDPLLKKLTAIVDEWKEVLRFYPTVNGKSVPCVAYHIILIQNGLA